MKYVKKLDSGCWYWTAFKLPAGYGQIVINKKKFLAHRASWQFHRGEIPNGLQVCHTCDNPSCINPDHLFLETDLGNKKDSVRKNRTKKSKLLSADDVKRVRIAVKNGHTQRDIAESFNIPQAYVSRIVTGRMFKWVV